MSSKSLKYSSTGVTAMLVSNIAMALAILIVKSHSKADALWVVALGNFLAAALSAPKNDSIKFQIKTSLSVFGWATAYASIYAVTIRYDRALSVSHVIIAESIVPLLAALAVSKKAISSRKALLKTAPILALLGIAGIRWHESGAQSGESILPFAAVSFLFFISQVCSRILASHEISFGRVLFFVNVLAGTVAGILAYGSTGFQGLGHALLGAAGFGVCTIVTQRTFLYGLARLPPIESALWISTSVPISVLLDLITLSWRRGTPSATSWVLSVLALSYCFLIARDQYSVRT